MRDEDRQPYVKGIALVTAGDRLQLDIGHLTVDIRGCIHTTPNDQLLMTSVRGLVCNVRCPKRRCITSDVVLYQFPRTSLAVPRSSLFRSHLPDKSGGLQPITMSSCVQ